MSAKSSQVPWNHRRDVLASKVSDLEYVAFKQADTIKKLNECMLGLDVFLQGLCKHLKVSQDKIQKISDKIIKDMEKKSNEEKKKK